MQQAAFTLLKQRFFAFCKKRLEEEFSHWPLEQLQCFDDLGDFGRSLDIDDSLKLSKIYKEAFKQQFKN